MKKLLSILAAGLLMICAFGGCIGTDNPADSNQDDSGTDDTIDSGDSGDNSSSSPDTNETIDNTTTSNNTTPANQTGGNETGGNETSEENNTQNETVQNYHAEYSGDMTFGDTIDYVFPINESAKNAMIKVIGDTILPGLQLIGYVDIYIYNPAGEEFIYTYSSFGEEIVVNITEQNMIDNGFGDWTLHLEALDLAPSYTATIDVTY